MAVLGHVHLKVRNLDRSVEFYTDVFDLSVTERVQSRYVFLSSDRRHHQLALQAVGEQASGPGAGVGLYHAAFEVDTPNQLRALYERLTTHDVDITPVDHRISKALYFSDPSGNGLEAYLDTRDSEEDRWRGRNRTFDPLRL